MRVSAILALLFASLFRDVFGASTQACDSSTGVCVAFAIPVTASTNAENADVLATVAAPASLGWVAFGFGQQMSGSLIFVLWPDNTDVVVSSRIAHGHFQPDVYSGPRVSVISSNVSSSGFTAQLSLSNATTWSASGSPRSLDISSSSAGVIWALGTQSPSNPSSPNSDFQQHSYQGVFSIDMAAAQSQSSTDGGGSGISDGNATQTGSPGSSSGPAAPVITGITGDGTATLALSYRDKIIITHGVLMGLAFVIFFPLGGVIIRFLAPILPVPVKLHYSVQIFSFAIVLAAAGLGIYLSQGFQFTTFHQVFGIIIVAIIFLQVTLGVYHHARFVRDKPVSRRWFTHAHLWVGRGIIVAGLINAGFGLRQAYVSWTYVGIWWGVCGSLALGYVIASVVTAQFRRKRMGEAFGNARGPGFSPRRYKTTESYEMGSQRSSPRRI